MSVKSDKEALIRVIGDWLATKEGQKRISEAVRTSESVAEQLGEAREVDKDVLNQPITL